MTRRYGDKKPPPWRKGLFSPEDLWTYVSTLAEEDEDPYEGQRSEFLVAWAKKIFEHDDIRLDGKRFRTRVDDDGINAYPADGEVYVNGTVEAYDEDRKEWRYIGYFMRRFSESEPETVYNEELKIGSSVYRDISKQPDWVVDDAKFGDKLKGNGFASIFNGHAFTLLATSGFKEARVSAVDDGTYVWGRVGYRSSKQEEIEALVDAFRVELQAFRADRQSLLTNEDQAEVIEYLIELARASEYAPDGPQWPEFIEAISLGGGGRERSAAIKEWFQAYAPFNSGTLPFSEELVPLDPRVK